MSAIFSTPENEVGKRSKVLSRSVSLQVPTRDKK